MVEKSLFEQMLTENQLKWCKQNKEHPRLQQLIYLITYTNTMAQESSVGGFIQISKDKVIKECERYIYEFKQWLEEEMNVS